jgi:hypothetical protein
MATKVPQLTVTADADALAQAAAKRMAARLSAPLVDRDAAPDRRDVA